MASTHGTKSAQVRARLNHPVIDADGHMIEFDLGFVDYLKNVGGATMVKRYEETVGNGYFVATDGDAWHKLTPEQRRKTRATRRPWWALPTKNTLDRATATLPKLQYERLDQFGLDFAVLYPSLGLGFPAIPDDDLRRAACRALNNFHADIYAEFSDRLTPAAVIPMHTPQEAIDELENAVRDKKLKALMMASHVRRPLAAINEKSPELGRYAFWIDNFCIDSEYDYDPVWAKCVELRTAPSYHSGTMGVGTRTSINNYMYNHIGHFAAASEALCKALFMSGVTRRFPTLRFAFLEGGVAWACSLYADLIGHWEKRNAVAVENYNPASLDRKMYLDLFRRYGGKMVEGKLEAMASRRMLGDPDQPGERDDWARCGIRRAEDIKMLFVPSFYFGCEADDPMNSLAFNSKLLPFGARLNAVFSSDIGHWDVPDMTEVTEEAYELVEHGLINQDDFRDFVFANPARLWAEMNPDFFKGTVVEDAVKKLMAAWPRAAA